MVRGNLLLYCVETYNLGISAEILKVRDDDCVFSLKGGQFIIQRLQRVKLTIISHVVQTEK